MTTSRKQGSRERLPYSPGQRLAREGTASLEIAQILRGLEQRDQDRRGELGWSLKPAGVPNNRSLALEEARRRYRLLHSGDSFPVALSFRMQELIKGVSSIPIAAVRVAWADDVAVRGRFAPTRLFLNVTLRDTRIPDMFSEFSFTANLPPYSDVSQLNPIDFDPSVVEYGQVGRSQEALMYELAPHPIEQGAN